MSKLVLSGDTSGSVTLDAPAVSGTTTLTLPTTSGTVVVTSGAQTIEFADGSASTPSITNSGDTNTGMFFPAADTIAFAEGGAESMRIDSSGNVLVTNVAGLGYGAGSGGTVTQATSKTTGVTINKPVGQITTAADALGAGSSAAFTVTNSIMSGTDVVIVNSQNINYSVRISDMASGSFKITIKNESGGSLSQAVVIGFAIIKGALS
jgi:hypothetical protein